MDKFLTGTSAADAALLIGISGIAAVLWMGSFIFFALPQMRLRFPANVHAGLNFLQSAFVLTLVAVVASPTALRIIAGVAVLYNLSLVLLHALARVGWQKMTNRSKPTFAIVRDDDRKLMEDISQPEAQLIGSDLVNRMTSWQFSSQLLLVFLAIVIWPTTKCVAITTVFLIWQGSRFVRDALVDDRVGKPAKRREPSEPEIKKALSRLRLGWLAKPLFWYVKLFGYQQPSNSSLPSPSQEPKEPPPAPE